MRIEREALATLHIVASLAAMESASVQDVLQLFRDVDQVGKKSVGLQRLSHLAASLRFCADSLQDLVWEAEESLIVDATPVVPRMISCRRLLEDALSRLSIPASEIDFSINGDDGMIAAYGDDPGWSIATMLQWFVDRALRREQRCELSFTCRQVGDNVEIAVQDRSERFPARALKHLFELGFASVSRVPRIGERDPSAPLWHDALALFTARTVLQWRHGCALRDETHLLPSDLSGHCFVFSFPTGSAALAVPAA